MKGLIIFFGIVVGIFLFLCVIALIIWLKIKKAARQAGLGNIKLNEVGNKIDELKREDSMRVRSASGMTKILLPNILRDFPEFNEHRLYNMTEEDLRLIFDALTNNDKVKLDKVPLLQSSLISLIDDHLNNHVEVSYSDIKFHDFALKDYTKIDGVATVTVSVSLEYYYRLKRNDVVEESGKYKKQTRYACNFIYVYDESLFKDYQNVVATNCPNCGAVIKSLGHKYCDYCGTAIKEINLKAWAFSSYKEY